MQALTFLQTASDDALVTELWAFGTAGLQEEDDFLTAFFADGLDLQPLLKRYPAAVVSEAPTPQPVVHPDTDPVFIGKTFAVLEPSSVAPVPPNRQILRIAAAGAFGSGRHESTQLVIEALEDLPLKNATVLDVGCGSAITAEAARLLGASHVFACDIHLSSLEQARNSFPQIPSFLGSADAIAPASIDVVIANISASVIDLLAYHLARVTRNEGTIILGGFTHNRVPESFIPAASLVRHDWLCWLTNPSNLLPQMSSLSPQPFPAVWW